MLSWHRYGDGSRNLCVDGVEGYIGYILPSARPDDKWWWSLLQSSACGWEDTEQDAENALIAAFVARRMEE
jgi:hypothetical protein